jgi:hypothetical protein
LVLLDGCIAEKPSPEIFTAWSGRMSQLQQDRLKQENSLIGTSVRSRKQKNT